MTDYSNILIRASAGTGKTYRLSNRYLGLLHRGVRPDQILATTFTRKAAGEILDRVIIRLAEATRDDKACRKLADELDEPALDRAQSLRLLRTMIRQLHRLRICTLDAFFAQLAGSCSLELALPPGWRIIETVHDNNLRREAIAMTLQGDSQREIERLLHLMAKGEAKRSISDMIQSTVNDLYDIYRETTQEAWQPLGRPKPLADAALEQAVDTLAEAPLPKHATAKKTRDKSVEAARNGDWELFIKNGLVDKVLSDDLLYSSKPLPDELVDAYQVLLAHARAVLLRQVADQTEATYALLDKFHSAYDKLKRDARSLQFNDVTHTLTHGSALTNIQHQQFRLDASIDHLLLDEFQDTSLAQWQVVRPFAQKVTRHVQNEQNRHASSFFCVGDVKQAIYGWRGGLSEIFDALQDEITDLTETAMDVSYRSAQPVIDTVNEVFSNLYRHPKLENDVVDWCNAFQPHTTARNDLGGYVTLGTGPATQEGEQAKDVKALYTAEQIREFVSQAPGCSIGVLVRSNDIVAQLIYELHRLGVPASEEGGNPLTDSPAVQTLLSLLKIVDHPADTVARFHVATSPLGPLLSYSDFRQTDSTLRLAQQIRSDLVENGYGPTIQAWTQLLKPLCDSRDRNRLQQLVEIAYAYASQATLRTDDFLAYLDAERVTDPTTAEVRVMTVHQSKGLQFDIVVLPDLDRLLTGQSDNCVVGQPSPTAPIDTVCLYRNEQIQKLLPPKIQKMFDTCADEISMKRSVFFTSR